MAVEQTAPVESILARHTAARAVYVAPVLVLIFGLARGWGAAAVALLGVGLVVGNFLLAGGILSISARISPAAYHAAALFGFFLRLGLITVTLFLITRLIEVDRVALAGSIAVSYMALLVWEAVAVARGRERDLDWIS